MSPRWPSCVIREERVAGRLWDLKGPSKVEIACEQLALGYAVLEVAPAHALTLAEALLTPPASEPELQAASWILAGRALVRLGRAGAAWEYFERAESRGVRPAGPLALFDFARAAQLTNHNAEALRALSAVSTQMAFMSPTFRQRVYLEAGALSILENKLQQALGLLELARHEPGAIEYRSLARAVLTAALELGGKPEQARTVKAEIPDIWAMTEGPLDPASSSSEGPGVQLLLDPYLAKATAAVLLAGVDASASKALYRELNDDAKTPEILRQLAHLRLRGGSQ